MMKLKAIDLAVQVGNRAAARQLGINDGRGFSTVQIRMKAKTIATKKKIEDLAVFKIQLVPLIFKYAQ